MFYYPQTVCHTYFGYIEKSGDEQQQKNIFLLVSPLLAIRHSPRQTNLCFNFHLSEGILKEKQQRARKFVGKISFITLWQSKLFATTMHASLLLLRRDSDTLMDDLEYNNGCK